MSAFAPPAAGQPITMGAGMKLNVPNNPIVPFIEGDGTGPDIWRASVRVLDAAVEKAYNGSKKIAWYEVYAGEKAFQKFNNWLPDETIAAFRQYLVGIKGPLTTPIGGGIRSLNVALRQLLDLYVCLRPVRWFEGVPSPVKRPADVNMVIFRENTEDIYAGIEFEAGSADAKKFLAALKEQFPSQAKKIRFLEECGVGIKPVSKEGSERLVRGAIEYAVANKRKSVTFVHKGNIMKFTEGAFMKWGYVLTRPKEFDVIATLNLNGDYLSDALAAQVGGIGIAPGGNINYVTGHAIFEATHGTAPKYANLDKVNPGSVILSGEMMLRHMGWVEAADLVLRGMDGAIGSKRVTYDFARLMEGATEIKCSEFGDNIIQHMK